MSAALCSFAISNLEPLIVKYICTIRKSAKINDPNVPGREFKKTCWLKGSPTQGMLDALKVFSFVKEKTLKLKSCCKARRLR